MHDLGDELRVQALHPPSADGGHTQRSPSPESVARLRLCLHLCTIRRTKHVLADVRRVLLAAERHLAVLQAPHDIHDVFINHRQATGGDQCARLALLLEQRGLKVWYDMHADDLTLSGMEDGVRRSKNMLVLMSDGVMSRPYCQEQRWAKKYGCGFISVQEEKEGHPGNVDLGKEKERAPHDLEQMLDDVEFIRYDRRGYLAEAMVDEIVRRCRTTSTSSSRRAAVDR